ncbi:hypothetical protein [Goodfellowiella coeruleoviolacea]|uniref:Uncharacterized protein n=1 Tax=Goodfellowiella coeruleoviolacea TaxID=334858 RepID=A0AAE3KIR8_9PSEU|nr:hypothetical protein [Goodfellowiella coeruleoviolacea]MCP2168755.1 hypothetical protein [Goodfellowiella coeruleoviolacea]
MASLGEVIARVRAALDLVHPDDLTGVADQLRVDTLPLLGQLARESNRPELGDAVTALAPVPDEMDRVAADLRTATALLHDYLARLAGTTSPADPPPAGPPPGVPPRTAISPALIDPAPVDPALIAEVQRAGHKITPERVIRIGRDQRGRIVWLEEGTPKSGARHILAEDRVGDFERCGVRQEDILDVVFRAVTVGRPVGVRGRGRVVHALTHQGRSIMVAVSVGDNGYLVGANPFNRGKLKPLP